MPVLPLRRLGCAAAAVLALAVLPAATADGAPQKKAPSRTTVAASPYSTSVVGDDLTLTATVRIKPIGGAYRHPSGTVGFTAETGGGTIDLGSAPVRTGCVLNLPKYGSCSASITTDALPVGTAVVTASYSGDTYVRPSVGTTSVEIIPAPVRPDPATLTAKSEVGDVRLTWMPGFDGGSPTTAYRVYRSTSETGPFGLIAQTPTPDFQDTTAATGVPYYYRVTTANAVGESDPSNIATGSPTALSPTSYDTTECDPEVVCASPTITASAGRSITDFRLQSSESSEPHTLTSSLGGRRLQGCSTPYRGFGATFNDTSTDAYKTASVRLTGPDAVYMAESSGYPGARIGCLGLATPWKTGPGPEDVAVWSPADGLYVGTPAYCFEMSEYQVTFNSYSEPCVSAYSFTNESTGEQYFVMDFRLPPGDGRISGSR